MFVGINPGMRSAATGHHFAGFSNRFWKLLFEAGLVPEPLTFADDGRLTEFGYGMTNLVARATPGIGDLAAASTSRPEPPPGEGAPLPSAGGRADWRDAVPRAVRAGKQRDADRVEGGGAPHLRPARRRYRIRSAFAKKGSAARASSSCRTPAAAMRTTATRKCCRRSERCASA